MAKLKKSGDSVRKGGGAIIVIAVLAVVVILALGAALVYLLLSRGSNNHSVAEAPAAGELESRRVLVTPENVEEILTQEPPQELDADRYIVTMNSTWNFESGASASSNSYVENSPENSFPVYFDIFLNETGETLYQSPILALGTHLEGIKLDKELEDGIYDCVMTYHLVDDDQKTLSTVSVALTLNIGKVSAIPEGN